MFLIKEVMVVVFIFYHEVLLVILTLQSFFKVFCLIRVKVCAALVFVFCLEYLSECLVDQF